MCGEVDWVIVIALRRPLTEKAYTAYISHASVQSMASSAR